MSSFQIILADPAWNYRDKARSGQRGVEYKYPTMTTAAIKALPVQRIAAPDCALFLWTTCPHLPVAIEVLAAWGFEYKTVAFVWVKLTKARKPAFGMGNWTRANAEFVLLGTRGKPRRHNAGVSQIICAPRTRHSEKPAVTRDKIVQLCGDRPRVELFARQATPGWTAVGNEIDGRSIADALLDL